MKSIFEYNYYKKFINDYIKAQPKRGYGLKRAFADAAGCQVGYISQIFNGENHLSGEQAESIARFIGLNESELDYFLTLILKDRAGSVQLKNFYLNALKEKQESHANLRNRMKITESLSIEDQAIYYSKWYFGAIHMLVTIPEYRTSDAIASYLNLPIKKVREAIDFLTSRSFLVLEKNEYIVKSPFLHLEKGSPLLISHHTNWRVQAIQSIANEREFDIHFSSCITLSDEDIKKIRTKISNYIEELSILIKPSKEERIYCLNVDFFEV